jgi:hypothetical protein
MLLDIFCPFPISPSSLSFFSFKVSPFYVELGDHGHTRESIKFSLGACCSIIQRITSLGRVYAFNDLKGNIDSDLKSELWV